ncbi:ABC transporter ATP-binding protein [Lutibacter sp. A80]|uniref:ABC transporter ATP-binding protein n=1 Tax=Lutibacter sp. A80 TaxID=2918453 RepID=UPI001F05B436|nr:ABC transporter ATP-binding protein [Lutibacter sp. A80]UMB60331.1 ABC transporter ATP-binding protein [Lutibacter sp. A80]
MSKPVIQVENLSKAYQLGQIGTGTLTKDLERFWTTKILGKEDPFLRIGETNDRSTKGESNIVWSLKDLNFSINQGDAVGIIGKNGAGKSTLLKLLSRVTAPTTGQIKVKGRIASLLEVGTGFHQELSGRENIYLNGAILGMRKKEITRKFDEIVDFAGVERYIDTPVKRYSSGMYVRLAFAVAAHLESEILIVDEVLAVGDAEFQKKCLGKMGEISKGEGRTVLFVSHNMASVKSLCTKSIVLEDGLVAFEGNTNEGVNFYLKGRSKFINSKIFNNTVFCDNIFNLKEINITNIDTPIEQPIVEDKEIVLNTVIDFLTDQPQRYHITYHLFNEMGEALFSFSNVSSEVTIKKGVNKLNCTFPSSFFQAGQFFLSLFVVEDKRKPIFIEKDILNFTVVPGQRDLGVYMGKEPGSIRPTFKWEN